MRLPFCHKKNVVRIEIIGIMDTSTYTQGVAERSKENKRGIGRNEHTRIMVRHFGHILSADSRCVNARAFMHDVRMFRQHKNFSATLSSHMFRLIH